jgi:ornithine cyclodeaminase/alanine dehydrogenase-like protein (mu-crystallin family)
MKWIGAADLAALSPYRDLVEALREAFAAKVTSPMRHHHEAGATTLLLMPAWTNDFTGLKTVTVKPDNALIDVPVVQASYQLIDNRTGTPVVFMDGTELTRRRTAAASALAADYLARSDAAVLAVVGAGALATHFARAHAAVRPITTVLIANRSSAKADAVAAELRADGFEARTATLEEAVRAADIVSCVTASTEPLVQGAWLKPGTHVDLAGAFRPRMRETDAEVVRRSRVYVDTHEGAQTEAGDLLQALAEGAFDFSQVQGDLASLCRGVVTGRKTADEITLFKSCGTALEDLAAAVMVYLRAR